MSDAHLRAACISIHSRPCRGFYYKMWALVGAAHLTHVKRPPPLTRPRLSAFACGLLLPAPGAETAHDVNARLCTVFFFFFVSITIKSLPCVYVRIIALLLGRASSQVCADMSTSRARSHSPLRCVAIRGRLVIRAGRTRFRAGRCKTAPFFGVCAFELWSPESGRALVAAGPRPFPFPFPHSEPRPQAHSTQLRRSAHFGPTKQQRD